MIKRAKRLALDFFKDIIKSRDSFPKKGKSRDRRSSFEADNGEAANGSSPSRMHTNNNESPPSPKFKRKSLTRKKSKKTNSLPLPLKKRPSWYDSRYRSDTDPSSTPSPTPSKGNKLKAERTRSEHLHYVSIPQEGGVIARVIIKDRDSWSSLRNSGSNSSDTSDITEYIADKLVLPIQNEIIKATKVEREVQIQSDSSPLRSPRDREEDDRAERRKATSFENVKVEHVKAEKTIDEYNKELFGIYDAMMQRELEEINTRFEDRRKELLDEIALRQSLFPPSLPPSPSSLPPSPSLRAAGRSALRSSLILLPKLDPEDESKGKEKEKKEEGTTADGKVFNRPRRSSTVVFNDTVVVRELDRNGTERTTSTTALSDNQRPRPRARNKQRRAIRSSPLGPNSNSTSSFPSPLRHSAESVVPSPLASSSSSSRSPTHSPASSPASSPNSSPPPSPTSSPTSSSPQFAHAWTRARTPSRATPPPVRNEEILLEDNVSIEEVGKVGEEEEIAAVIAKYEEERLSLWTEIELREVHEACAELDQKRMEIMQEIEFREQSRESAARARIERRQAIKLRQTMMRLAGIANGTLEKGEEGEIKVSHSKLKRKISRRSPLVRKKSSSRAMN